MDKRDKNSEPIPYQKPEFVDLNSKMTAAGTCTNGSGDSKGSCVEGNGVTGYGDEPEGP